MSAPIKQRFPRPSVMGVVNVTPDSFSDAGVNFDPDDAVVTARRMVEDGAAIVDVGGESTRPGSQGVTAEEELRRVEPVLERLAMLRKFLYHFLPTHRGGPLVTEPRDDLTGLLARVTAGAANGVAIA